MIGLYNSDPTVEEYAQRWSVLFDVLARTREVAKSRGAPGAQFTLKGEVLTVWFDWRRVHSLARNCGNHCVL